MRCINCLWFPMEEDKELPGLICPNCGYEHLESCPEIVDINEWKKEILEAPDLTIVGVKEDKHDND